MQDYRGDVPKVRGERCGEKGTYTKVLELFPDLSSSTSGNILFPTALWFCVTFLHTSIRPLNSECSKHAALLSTFHFQPAVRQRIKLGQTKQWHRRSWQQKRRDDIKIRQIKRATRHRIICLLSVSVQPRQQQSAQRCEITDTTTYRRLWWWWDGRAMRCDNWSACHHNSSCLPHDESLQQPDWELTYRKHECNN